MKTVVSRVSHPASAGNGPTSPCNGVCRLDEQGLCAGCLRSGEEIAEWPVASRARQREILKAIQQRRRR